MLNKITGAIGKLIALILRPPVLIFLIIVGIIYFGGFFTASFTEGNLGNWVIGSYNPNTGEIIIPIEKTANSNGWLGAYLMHNQGTSVIINQKDCEEIGWQWRSIDQTPNDGYQCYLDNKNWFEDKTYTSTITYTDTCIDSRGCGCAQVGTGANPECIEFITLGTSYTYDYTPDFNGFTIYLDKAEGISWIRTYKGNIKVYVPKPGISPPPIAEDFSIEQVEKTEKEISLTECYANIDCVEICGDKTPTCQGGYCYCDNVIITEKTSTKSISPPSSQDLTSKEKGFLDRLSNFVSNIIDRIINFFRGIF